MVYVIWKYRLKPASNNRQHPATSELRSVFAGYVCSLHLWNVCTVRVDSCSCVQIEHACPTLCWKLCGLPEMQQFCLCVMLLSATYDRFMLQN